MKYLTACLVLVCIVQVLAQSNGDIKFVDGVSSSRGLVKMFYQGEWGTICHQESDVHVAQVICRSAGFNDLGPSRYFFVFESEYVNLPWLINNRAIFYSNKHRGRILLDDVRCAGNESNILQCSHRAIGRNDCTHFNDIAVDCYGMEIGRSVQLRYGTATDGVLVLSQHNGTFGTVCDKEWSRSRHNSIVACRMLGVDTSRYTPIQVSRTYYEETAELPQVDLPEMRCHGNETNLTQCYGEGLLSPVYNYKQMPCHNVAIDCLGSANVAVSLVNGNDTAGEVQLTYHGESGFMCDGNLGNGVAKVFCRMLGYGDYAGVVLDGNNSTAGTKRIIDNVYRVTGNEKNIADCGALVSLHEDPCPSILVIACLPQPDIAVRLVDGNDTYGRLEIQRNHGQWGTVCEDQVDKAVATVVCRMLDLPTDNVVATQSGQVNKVHTLNWVSCAGDEDNLNQCYLDSMCFYSVDMWMSCA